MKHISLYFRLLMFICAAGLPFNILAQSDSSAALTRKLEIFRSRELSEKVYAHIDRTFYVTGETLWFSLYYVDGTFNRPLDISKVAYVEVIDKENKSILQVKVALTDGAGRGSIFIPASLGSGNYVVRAYTNWMKNFTADAFFHQTITVVNPFTKLGLIEPKEVAKYDVQFFPESGNLVTGISSTVGFRAADIHGLGIDFHGTVVNGNNDTVAHFAPHKFGIGSFVLKPVAGQSYTAVIRDKRNTVSRYPLPGVAKEGYVVHVVDTTGDKVKVTISAVNDPGFCYLLAHTRKSGIMARMAIIQNGKSIVQFDKSRLGGGISHFTVFDSKLTPVAERLYFKQPENMNLDIHADNSTYAPRKKVSLDFTAVTSDIPAANSNLSVSVSRIDSLDGGSAPDIRTWLWLTSELKGTIESPSYYAENHGEEGSRAIDNLMLTHGWSRFRWDDVLNPKSRTYEFLPEYRGHIINGIVKGLDPESGKHVVAFLSNPDKNIRLYPSRSAADGKVRFELREFSGSRKLIAQTNTQIDSIYDLEIFSPFMKSNADYHASQFAFADALTKQLTNRSLYMQVQNTFHEFKNDRFAKPYVDTVAFYGRADERYLLDDYTRFPTMEEVLSEYVPGVRVRKRRRHFSLMVLDNLNKTSFKDNPLVLLDGVPVFDINKVMALDPRKVRKLEVLTRRYFLGPLSFEGVVSYTTYHGDLSDFELDRRSLVVDYEGMQAYREFFSPQYDNDAQRNNRVPDVRNLVFWKPNLKTGADGKARIEFYTPDVDGKYRIVLQGLSLDGKPGASTSVIEVNSKRSY